jgi:hypothetical protein
MMNAPPVAPARGLWRVLVMAVRVQVAILSSSAFSWTAAVVGEVFFIAQRL